MTIVLVTGGFDPLHPGHINLFEAASELGDHLVVGINSDGWLTRKKGKAFMTREERSRVIAGLSCVDSLIYFDDSDGTANDAIDVVRGMYPQDHIIFANGGDRTTDSVPEKAAENVSFVYGVGGDFKVSSSSELLSSWSSPVTERIWGKYEVLRTLSGQKIKLLTVNPFKSLSMQRHEHREEHWTVLSGAGYVSFGGIKGKELKPSDTVVIPKMQWHQLSSASAFPLVILETQIGQICDESDIDRNYF